MRPSVGDDETRARIVEGECSLENSRDASATSGEISRRRRALDRMRQRGAR